MVSVFRVVWSGCPVSRSPLRRKDEQRIRRVAGEQLQQRLEASKRTSMQSGRVHTDMVHLGLVEGKSRVESCVDLWSDEHRDFLTSRYINIRYKFRYKYQGGFFSARWHAVPACKPDWFVVFSKVSAARIARMLGNRATNSNAAWSRAKRMLRRRSNRRKVSLERSFTPFVRVSNDVVNGVDKFFTISEAYEASSECVDKHPDCSVVVKNGYCRIKYYKYSCCRCRE